MATEIIRETSSKGGKSVDGFINEIWSPALGLPPCSEEDTNTQVAPVEAGSLRRT